MKELVSVPPQSYPLHRSTGIATARRHIKEDKLVANVQGTAAQYLQLLPADPAAKVEGIARWREWRLPTAWPWRRSVA